MSSRLRSTDTYSEPNDRQAGTLVMTERWWREHYDEIAEHGYKLRPRYHPQWQPSWLTSGKNFYSVEDGQATIVRIVVFCLRLFFSTLMTAEGSDGCHPNTRQPPGHAQESSPGRWATRIEDQPAILVIGAYTGTA
jgi:hypothetical protein